MEAADAQDRQNPRRLVEGIGLFRKGGLVPQQESSQHRRKLAGGKKRRETILPADLHPVKLSHPVIPEGEELISQPEDMRIGNSQLPGVEAVGDVLGSVVEPPIHVAGIPGRLKGGKGSGEGKLVTRADLGIVFRINQNPVTAILLILPGDPAVAQEEGE